ncbi:Uncharacterised protein [uncultured Butyricicoccus sp.]|uniref:Uncharacterized protein n=1 Tax=Agathobaculum ammoniilyticum TaxID=2981778 RepID=A0ABT2U2D4_9FIRM|nr:MULTISPECIES: hypothetical protein [Butyricicoccaceae]MCU6788779.1 hypothetical protein [Agathobaculum ammoniilyticum]WOC74788.1 hypothetical protein RX717_12460 [Intestinibacillus sp. NTUH-41-i26]SCI92578.1 Uncharacterised protein [uncultured Butyricicoccus sp.]
MLQSLLFNLFMYLPDILFLILLYFVVKKAVKDAIDESNRPKF